MVNKLFKSIFAAVLVIGSALGFVACENEGDDVVADPSVEVSATSLNFTNEEGNETLDVTANADWKAETDADWVTITPAAGKGDATITIAVSANDTGAVRTTVVKVIALHKTYGAWDTKKVTVSQSATETPTVEEELLYGDNFDGEEATKTYGSGSSWPYIDQFPQFANQEGPASENVTYSGNGVSVRANSTSNSQYSDYDGSGLNNIFFGSSAYFQVNNITLAEGQQNLKLTFGSEKYTQDGDSTFKNEEFRIYVSKDGNAWAEIKEYTFAGTEGGRWNVATAEFTLNAVPETLYLKFAATVASVYRLDDVKLYTGNGGQAIDLDNIEAPQPSEAKKVTVAEFLAAAEDSTIYELTGEITNVTNTTYGNFYLKDATGEVLIYGLCSPSGEQKYWAESGAKVGDTITVQTVRTSYNGTPQGKDAIFVSLVPGEGGGNEPTPGPEGTVTIAEAIAAADNTAITIENATVIGVYARGVLVEDATGKLLVYAGSAVSAKVGDVVKVEGSMATYGGLRQVGTPTVTVTGTTSYSYPTATVMDGAAMDAYLSNPEIKYVEYTGTLAISGYYYNVTVDGAATAVGSLAYVIEGTVDASLDGKEIVVKGWTIGFSGGKYVNTMITSVTAADGGTTEPTPEPEPTPGDVQKVTVAQFLAASEGDTVYELTGIIKNVANTNYGNFDLQDETGTVYVYGIYDADGNKVFTSLGLKEGDTLTMRGVRTSYNDEPQVGNGVYVSHVVGEAPEQPANSATLSFADVANRTSFSTEQQVWEQNGVKLTNNKAASTSNVADYSAPARFYKSSSITVEGEKAMTKIEFACNNGTYATALQDSVTSGTVTIDGSIVTVTLASAATSYNIATLSAQVRMNSLTVYYE